MNEIRRNKMDLTQIGTAMVLLPVFFAVSFVVTMLLLLMGAFTIKAYIDRDTKMLAAMTLTWSFVIGTGLILIGSV